MAASHGVAPPDPTSGARVPPERPPGDKRRERPASQIDIITLKQVTNIARHGEDIAAVLREPSQRAGAMMLGVELYMPIFCSASSNAWTESIPATNLDLA